MANMKSLTVGVTGAIGSGKTEVCKVFASLGARIISADQVAKDIIETNTQVRRDITRAFGQDSFTIDGALDREKLADRVFASPTAAARIDAIVHPHVLRELKRLVDAYRSEPREPLLVIEAALMYEAGAGNLVDYVIVVDADLETRIERIVGRHGLDRKRALARERAQMLPAKKREMADFVIVNDADLAALRDRARFLFGLLKTLTENR
jgi:dephospho-CoA kinase